MARKTVAMVAQQSQLADGSILVKPVAVVADREIGAKEAAGILGVHVQTIYALCELGGAHGGLEAWKVDSARGNAKWRISLQSVYGYRDARRAARSGFEDFPEMEAREQRATGSARAEGGSGLQP